MDIKELKKQLADEHYKSVDFAGFECYVSGNLVVCTHDEEDFKGVLLYNRKTEEYEYFGDSLNSFDKLDILEIYFFRKGQLEKLPQVFNLETDPQSESKMEIDFIKNGNVFLTPQFLYDLRDAFPANNDTRGLINDCLGDMVRYIDQFKVSLSILSNLLDDMKEEARNKTTN